MSTKLGLALGGGGARGIAHIGVLQALEEERIPIHILSGTSIGSIVGALYAYHKNSKKVRQVFSEFMKTEAFHRMGFQRIEAQKTNYEPGFLQQFSKLVSQKLIIKLNAHVLGIISAEKMHHFLSVLFKDIHYSDLQIPFSACAANLLDGSGKYFNDGDLLKNIQASSSIPGWVEPTLIEDIPYVDGIIFESVPVQAARNLGANKVIAVDVTKRNFEKMPLESALDVVSRTEHISKNHLTDHIIAAADMSIHPDTKGYDWYEYSHFEELMYEGREAVRKNISAIHRMLNE